MPRQRQIDDKTLISLIEQFFVHECKGNPTHLKKPEIARYVAKEGYPGYAVTTLRRNKTACNYINTLKAADKDRRLMELTTYKTLDVENFLATHKGKAALLKALTELDCYYKSIADSAVSVSKEYQVMKGKEEALQRALEEAITNLQRSDQFIESLKHKIIELTTERDRLAGIVNDYVYPDICNELLSKDKQLRNVDTIIDEKKLQRKIINFKSIIDTAPGKSPAPVSAAPTNSSRTVIQSLTDFLEEDDE